ncbi:hypothetical protein BDW68DRAFT_168283, partial [Aspergillus falconensis]
MPAINMDGHHLSGLHFLVHEVDARAAKLMVDNGAAVNALLVECLHVSTGLYRFFGAVFYMTEQAII